MDSQVEQIDCNAAADLIETYWSGSDAAMMKLARSYREGHTQGVFPRAFAAHRLASLALPKVESETWQPMENTAWLDGRDVVLCAHGMEVSARYCEGRWTEDSPIAPREYDGAVWSCFDDAFQFAIEEMSKDPAEWWHGPVTFWRDAAPLPLNTGGTHE